MNGYSKIRLATNFTSKSRSEDFSALSFSPPQAHEEQNPDPKATFRSLRGQVQAKTPDLSPGQDGGEEESYGERFGVILSRNYSSASQRFRASERSQGRTLQAVVRRAFSMRRSSSVAAGYWRIHDTGDHDECDVHVDMMHDEEQQQQVRPSRKKRGRFLRACKRLFGF